MTGMTAPMAKRMNEVIAATQAEPPSSLGSTPSSSIARVFTARAGSAMSCAAISFAAAGSSPLAR